MNLTKCTKIYGKNELLKKQTTVIINTNTRKYVLGCFPRTC